MTNVKATEYVSSLDGILQMHGRVPVLVVKFLGFLTFFFSLQIFTKLTCSVCSITTIWEDSDCGPLRIATHTGCWQQWLNAHLYIHKTGSEGWPHCTDTPQGQQWLATWYPQHRSEEMKMIDTGNNHLHTAGPCLCQSYPEFSPVPMNSSILDEASCIWTSCVPTLLHTSNGTRVHSIATDALKKVPDSSCHILSFPRFR